MSIRILAAAAALAVAGIAGTAQAADLGGAPRYVGPAYPPPSNIERWTGFYFGASLGYGWGTAGIDGTAGSFSFDQSGLTGGVFGGYNWQFGRTVVGIEGDIGTGNLGGSASGVQGAIETDLNAIGSLRLRAGYLATPSLLLYATGGFAMADFNFRYQGVTDKSTTLTGYQLGLGAEKMLSTNWTMRLEYIYTDFMAETSTVGVISNRIDPDFHQVRAGLSFKF